MAAKENLIGGALLGRLANSLGAFVVGRRRRLSLDHRCAALSGKNSRIGHLLDYLVGCANYMALFIGLGVGLSHGEIGKSALYLGLAAGVANPIILLVRLCHERRSGADAVAHPYLVGVELEDFIYLIGPITWLAGPEYFLVPFGVGTIGYLCWQITLWQRNVLWFKAPPE